MHKNYFASLMLFCLVRMLPTSFVAQNSNEPQSPPAGERSEHEYGHRRWDPSQHAEMLGKQLKLNSDQQSKVLDILKSEQSQMEKLRSDSSLSQDDRRSNDGHPQVIGYPDSRAS
jgi:hypothetical protein